MDKNGVEAINFALDYFVLVNSENITNLYNSSNLKNEK